MDRTPPTYKNHRFPIEMVARAIWLCFRLNVSLRKVEEMILERGVAVSYETVRRWCRAHGATITARTFLQRRVASRRGCHSRWREEVLAAARR
jgi:putative transposase